MALDTELDILFHQYSGKDDLPQDEVMLSRFIGYTMDKIVSEPERSRRILEDIEIEKSARYLVPALRMEERRTLVSEILVKKKHHYVANLLGILLSDEQTRESAEEIFRQYGAAYAARPLAGALRDAAACESAGKLFLHYGPSKHTVHSLIAVLGRPYGKIPAMQILTAYGSNRYTNLALIHALENPLQSGPAQQVLKSYGPTKGLVCALTAALADPHTRESAYGLLKDFGPDKKLLSALVGGACRRAHSCFSQEIIQ